VNVSIITGVMEKYLPVFSQMKPRKLLIEALITSSGSIKKKIRKIKIFSDLIHIIYLVNTIAFPPSFG